MKPAFLSLFFSMGCYLLSAQPFTVASPAPPFVDVFEGAVTFIDIEGDQDLDVLITGEDALLDRLTLLYLNDGNGTFTQVPSTPFEGVWNSAVAIANVDGVGGTDILLAGANTDLELITTLYLNDGSGNFTEAMGMPFLGVSAGAIAFEDVDGKDGPDVLIAGAISEMVNRTNLYLNDGNGGFTMASNTPFKDVRECAIAFADIDDDDDQDVLIMGDQSGENTPFALTTDLYLNDGQGNFSLDMTNSFVGLADGGADFADINGDDYPDLVITGVDSAGDVPMFIYLNDRMGGFTQTLFLGASNTGISTGTANVIDIDRDNDPDIFLTGEDSAFNLISALYLNDGGGNFSLVTGTPFVGVFGSAVAVGDVDGDQVPDILITGGNMEADPISRLYINSRVFSAADPTIAVQSSFELFPNPTSGDIVQLWDRKGAYTAATLTLFDVNGRMVLRDQAIRLDRDQPMELDISALGRGVFFLQLTANQHPITTLKLVKW